MMHWSDCAQHNEPAYPNGACNCGGLIDVELSATGSTWVASIYKVPATFRTVVQCPGTTLEEAMQSLEFKRRRAQFKHAIKRRLYPISRHVPYVEWIQVRAL